MESLIADFFQSSCVIAKLLLSQGRLKTRLCLRTKFELSEDFLIAVVTRTFNFRGL